jgi:hypothetical protein
MAYFPMIAWITNSRGGENKSRRARARRTFTVEAIEILWKITEPELLLCSAAM